MKVSILTLAAATLFVANAFGAGAGNTGGGCYNLQIIASPEKVSDMDASNRHSIFVLRNSDGTTRTKIGLAVGDFKVLDGNGTDGIAKFQLPDPDPTDSGTSAYSVYMRLVGKPGSGIDLTTCLTDALGATYCSEDAVSMIRQKGKTSFQNVSRELLTINADLDGDGDLDQVQLFDDALSEYFWQVDSTGKMHAQLRFCPVGSDISY
jgi:hypothetical protein